MVNPEIWNLLFVFKSSNNVKLYLKSLFLLSRHPYFERKKNDLYTNLTINLQDALNGFNISFPHLDGHQVRY